MSHQMNDVWNKEENRNPKAEPLPFIDYNLIRRIISIPRSELEKSELDGFASLIQTRKLYYAAHYRFQYEYNGLQDANVYDKMLQAEKMKLEDMGEEKDDKLWEKLKWVKINIRKNKKDIEDRLEQVRMRWQKHNCSTAEFGQKKTEFVETMLPRFMNASEQPEVKAQLVSSSGLFPNPQSLSFFFLKQILSKRSSIPVSMLTSPFHLTTAAAARIAAVLAITATPESCYREPYILSPPSPTTSPLPPNPPNSPSPSSPATLTSTPHPNPDHDVGETPETLIGYPVELEDEARQDPPADSEPQNPLHDQEDKIEKTHRIVAAAASISKDARKRGVKNATNSTHPHPPTPKVNPFAERIISARNLWLEYSDLD